VIERRDQFCFASLLCGGADQSHVCAPSGVLH